MTFQQLGLTAPILRALDSQGYQRPSPIQAKAIPPALAGRDVLGCAQTGTGKTCAFAAPILQLLSARRPDKRPIRALILTPTRELAIQIGESFESYGRHLSLRCSVIFGGVGQTPQVEALKRGVDILVATPGRLMDLHEQGFIHLERLEIFVLDEADRMLDMGFIHDVRKILKWLPEQKQTMLFSATMPPEITDLVNSLLKDPVRVAVDPISSPVEVIRQSVYFVDRGNKTQLLSRLVEQLNVTSALVFTRTKHGANKVARDLEKSGIPSAAIHGNKSQTARQQALSDFKAGRLRCLVATDIAARGLDIEDLSHVFNYNLPEVPETYVHRIGRTGRAGKGGVAVSLCDYSEKPLLRDIEKLMGKKVPVVEDHPWPMQVFEVPLKDKNGRPVNADDLEARAAARELKKAREEAKKARALSPAPPEPPQPEPEPEEKRPARSRRRNKSKATQTVSAPATPVLPEAEEEPYNPLPSRPERPRGLRPGVLMDTGDAMPVTEFVRPNPLDSDVVMDATARLLSSRRLPRQESPARPGPSRRRAEPERPAPPRQEEPSPKKSRRRGKKKAISQPAPEPPKKTPKKTEKAQRSLKPEKPAQTRQSKAGGEKHSGKKSFAHRDRRPPEPPPRSHVKDSTEQHSLMKPFYLEH